MARSEILTCDGCGATIPQPDRAERRRFFRARTAEERRAAAQAQLQDCYVLELAGGEIHLCRPTCIEEAIPAILNALERERRQRELDADEP